MWGESTYTSACPKGVSGIFLLTCIRTCGVNASFFELCTADPKDKKKEVVSVAVN